MSWETLFTVPNVIFVIPIVAILVGGIVSMVHVWFRHRERMAMISQGMHPDQKAEEPEEED